MPESSARMISFPLGGISQIASTRNQRLQQTRSALNVIDRDTIGRQIRGGSRPGTTKFLAQQFMDQFNMPAEIQAVGQVVTVSTRPPTPPVPDLVYFLSGAFYTSGVETYIQPVYRYAPIANAYSLYGTNIPTPSASGNGFRVGSDIWIIDGRPNSALSFPNLRPAFRNQKFSITTGTWSTGANDTVASNPYMCSATFAVGVEGYRAGGYFNTGTSQGATRSVSVYDTPNNTWTAATQLPTSLSGSSSTSSRTNYNLGWTDGTDGYYYQNRFTTTDTRVGKYTVSTDSWTPGLSVPSSFFTNQAGRANKVGFNRGTTGAIMSHGFFTTESRSATFEYIFSTNSYTKHLDTGPDESGGVGAGSAISGVVIRGRDSTSQNDTIGNLDLYDYGGNTWSAGAEVPAAARRGECVAIAVPGVSS